MTDTKTIPESTIDPVCGKTFDPRTRPFSASDEKGTHYFCSDKCRRQYETAGTKAKKGFWAKYTDRLKNTHCTQTPPECR